jgi:hypothetical protein
LSEPLALEPIVLCGELSLQDVRRAIRLENRSRRKLVLLWLAYVAAFVALLVAIAVSSRPCGGSLTLRFLACAAILVALPAGRWAWYRHKLRQAWKRKTGFFQPVEATIDADGISFRMTDATSRLRWSFFAGRRHDGGPVVLLYHPNGWSFLARSRFPDDDSWHKPVTHVTATLPPK